MLLCTVQGIEHLLPVLYISNGLYRQLDHSSACAGTCVAWRCIEDMGVDHFTLDFDDIDTVFRGEKSHRRVQQVLITHTGFLLDIGLAFFGLGDFRSAKKILTRPPPL